MAICTLDLTLSCIRVLMCALTLKSTHVAWPPLHSQPSPTTPKPPPLPHPHTHIPPASPYSLPALVAASAGYSFPGWTRALLLQKGIGLHQIGCTVGHRRQMKWLLALQFCIRFHWHAGHANAALPRLLKTCQEIRIVKHGLAITALLGDALSIMCGVVHANPEVDTCSL